MVTEDIHLTGMVLHSPNLERMVSFYQGILGAEFKEEKHGDGPLHYACEYGKNELLEIYPNEKNEENYASLEEVMLNSQDIEKLKPFYQSLLGIEPSIYGYMDHSKSYVFGHHKAKIKLHSANLTATPPSPMLLLSTPYLDKVAKRMKAEIKESDEDQKRYLSLADPEKRKILIYEQKSWWQKLF